jgi:ABC-2 type transport system permease protein
VQPFGTIVRRELGAYFFSWSGYVIIASVLFLLGFSFLNLVQALASRPSDLPVTQVFYSTYYFWQILIPAAPVITMRAFAQEKSSGTFETLMTTPVSDLQVVLAKFTGAMVFYLVTWLPLLGCLLLVRHYISDRSVFDWGTIVTNYLGIALLGGVYVSIGCFASALSRSQIIAAILSFALGAALFWLSFLAMDFSAQTGWQAQLFAQVGLIEHMSDFARGVVDTRPVVYCLSLTGFFIFLTYRVVESRRWT